MLVLVNVDWAIQCVCYPDQQRMLIQKIPELRAFSSRGRSSAFEGGRKNGVMLYHAKANQNFAKNKFKTKKVPLTW